jgi:hypothetical protein
MPHPVFPLQKIYTSMTHSIVKYYVKKKNILLKRNYSYTITLYSTFHGETIVESFVGSFLTVE